MESDMRRLRPRIAALTAAIASIACAATGTGLASGSSAAGSAANGGVFLGVFRETTPFTAVADSFKADTGITPASVQWFDAWSNKAAFPVQQAKDLWARGIMLSWTWEPWNPALSLTDPDQITLDDITSGQWDAYIKARGTEMASLGFPIQMRWGHEVNGNWYPWNPALNGNDPAKYVQAYRHVHDLLVQVGATNVQWVWTITNGSTPNESWNNPALEYPGNAYVDWVALDGYNWGKGPSWDPSGNYWSSFDQVFSGAYQTAVSIAPDKPIQIAETASSIDGGDKAAWITQMFASIEAGKYPKLRLLSYFDQKKEEEWQIASSSASLQAFKTGASSSTFKGTGRELALITGGTTPSPTPTPTPTPAGACTATLSTVGSWPGGYQVQVTVKAGKAAIHSWRTAFTLPASSAVASGWSGQFSSSAGQTVVTNAPWNGELAAGASTQYGFVGSGAAPASGLAVSCS